jgi:hypothetical protein
VGLAKGVHEKDEGKDMGLRLGWEADEITTEAGAEEAEDLDGADDDGEEDIAALSPHTVRSLPPSEESSEMRLSFSSFSSAISRLTSLSSPKGCLTPHTSSSVFHSTFTSLTTLPCPTGGMAVPKPSISTSERTALASEGERDSIVAEAKAIEGGGTTAG